MTEESEKMMLLLKELALFKRSESGPDAEPGLSRSLAADKIKEITREMKRLAHATKNKSRKN